MTTLRNKQLVLVSVSIVVGSTIAYLASLGSFPLAGACAGMLLCKVLDAALRVISPDAHPLLTTSARGRRMLEG